MNLIERYRALFLLVCFVLFCLLQISWKENNTETHTCRTTDSLALVDFYHRMNGEEWVNKEGWLKAPLDEWYGVTLDSLGCHVDDIAMSGNNINGDIYDLNLPKLRFLRLYGNKIGGELPDFRMLPNLEQLILNNNELIGAIPNFSSLSHLKWLLLGQNKLEGMIPDFTNFPQLENLSIYNNSLTELPNFTNLPNLKILSIASNQFTGNIPDFTGTPQLQLLRLEDNNFSGSIPDFTNLPKLKELYLNRNPIGGTIPDFTNLPNLKHLDLWRTQVEGTIPNFSNLPNLQFLFLDDNKLVSPIPDFSNSTRLYILSLRYNQFSGTIPAFAFQELTRIDLSYNNLDEPIPYLENCPHLSGFFIDNNQLDFGDLESMIEEYDSSQVRYYTRYAPQAMISVYQNGESMYVNVGGKVSNNTYEWYMTNDTINPVSIIQGDSSFIPNKEGTYYCKVTNSVVTNTKWEETTLVLQSAPYEYRFTGMEDATISLLDILMYFDPAQRSLHLKNIHEIYPFLRVRLYNLSGQVIQDTELRNVKDDMILYLNDTVQTGCYLLELEDEHGRRNVQKIMAY